MHYRDFKKSTAMCKVHNVGLRYINIIILAHPVFFTHMAMFSSKRTENTEKAGCITEIQ